MSTIFDLDVLAPLAPFLLANLARVGAARAFAVDLARADVLAVPSSNVA